MAEIKAPVLFCNVYPPAVAISLELPFGMPKLEAPDVTCDGLVLFTGNITASLAAFYPIIKIVGCILKVVEAVKAVPDSILQLDPTLVIKKIAELADCISMFLDFTGVNPIPYCKFIRDLTGIMIGILNCINQMMQVFSENAQAVTDMRASGDAELILLADCLEEQNNLLMAALTIKFSSMQLVVTLLNAILGALPPVQQVLGGPIAFDGTAGLSQEVLDTLIDVLTVVNQIATICAGG